MIKAVSKFKIIKNIFKLKKSNKPVPYSEKPIVAYMPGMFLEPKRRNSSQGIFSDMFGNFVDGLLANDKKIEHKEKQTSLKKEKVVEPKEESIENLKSSLEELNRILKGIDGVGIPFIQSMVDKLIEKEIKTESKTEQKVITKAKSKVKSKSLVTTKTKTQTQTSQPYPINKIIEPTKNIFQTMIENFSGALRSIGIGLANCKDSIADVKDTIVYNIERKKSIAESNKLLKAREKFANKLQAYQGMFNNEDIKPDISEFAKYRYLSFIDLASLRLVLEACIKHQEAINRLKSRYCRGASNFSSGGDDRNLRSCKLQDLPPELINKPNLTRQDLIILYNIFMKNSKTIEAPIKSFHNISKSFFKRTKSNMEEIFEIKKRWFWAERIPKINIIPKTIRITGQINLTRCIMRDYREIMEKYIKNGINPTVTQYGNQYNIINSYTNIFKNNTLNKNEIKFADKLLYKMKNAKEDRVSTYTRLFDTYATAGYNINNFCKNVRLKGGIGLGLKALFTFFSPI